MSAGRSEIVGERRLPPVDRGRRWLLTQWDDVLARYAAGGDPNALATCFAVCGLECIGSLEALPDGKRERVAAELRGLQEPGSGLFSPGVLKREDLTGRAVGHNATYLKMQMTYFALHALDALGSGPHHDITLASRLCNKEYLTGWLDAGPWHDPWLESNHIMFAITFLEDLRRRRGEARALSAVDAVLDYLDARQDSTTGLWQPDDGLDMENAVFAAYHFLPFYFWRGRCPNGIPQIIDSTLSVQSSCGGFGSEEGRGACEDLDAVHTLVMMSLVSEHRRDDVRDSLERCLSWILGLQNDDGGFPNYPDHGLKKSLKRRVAEMIGVDKLFNRPAYVPMSSYSGWRPLTVRRGDSDMWGAWFRMLALRLICEFLNPDWSLFSGAAYRKLPGLGWHDVDAIRKARRKGV